MVNLLIKVDLQENGVAISFKGISMKHQDPTAAERYVAKHLQKKIEQYSQAWIAELVDDQEFERISNGGVDDELTFAQSLQHDVRQNVDKIFNSIPDEPSLGDIVKASEALADKTVTYKKCVDGGAEGEAREVLLSRISRVMASFVAALVTTGHVGDP